MHVEDHRQTQPPRHQRLRKRPQRIRVDDVRAKLQQRVAYRRQVRGSPAKSLDRAGRFAPAPAAHGKRPVRAGDRLEALVRNLTQEAFARDPSEHRPAVLAQRLDDVEHRRAGAEEQRLVEEHERPEEAARERGRRRPGASGRCRHFCEGRALGADRGGHRSAQPGAPLEEDQREHEDAGEDDRLHRVVPGAGGDEPQRDEKISCAAKFAGWRRNHS